MLNVFWFRRDLRLDDNAGLFYALSEKLPVLPLFILDKDILQTLDNPDDIRVSFLTEEINLLKSEIELAGSSLLVKYGKPEDVIRELTNTYTISAVFTNHDYEPYARDRDKKVGRFLQTIGIRFLTFKDQVIFEKNEILKDNGGPYTIYTPYSKKWKSAYRLDIQGSYPSIKLTNNFFKTTPFVSVSPATIGFNRQKIIFPEKNINIQRLDNYHQTRDYPSLNGTSRLGVHLRFGTISIRKLAGLAFKSSEIFLNELIWREFYMMILWHFPHVTNQSFKPQYDFIAWRNDESEFEAWCSGKTGYPIVDAGMRELNHSGYMHNRLRMITASFLTKHLLTDWRWGEAYFAQKLLDYELSSNNGSWQWAAGTGCDAAPYFRVFNPDLQTEKFDRERKYIKQWVPEFLTDKYPKRIVDHSEARNRAINTYKKALEKKY